MASSRSLYRLLCSCDRMFPFKPSIRGKHDLLGRAKGETMFGRKAVVLSGAGVCLWMLAGSLAQPPQHSSPPSTTHHEGEGKGETDPVQKRLAGLEESLDFAESALIKRVDDLMLLR